MNQKRIDEEIGNPYVIHALRDGAGRRFTWQQLQAQAEAELGRLPCAHSSRRIKDLIGILKGRIAKEEQSEWGSEDVGGSVLLFGRRGVWSCDKGSSEPDEFGVWVQSHSTTPPRPVTHAWLQLKALGDGLNSTDIYVVADEQWQPLFESLVSELVEPVQTQRGAKPKGKPGRPGLEREEEVRRVAFALWGEELKEADGKIPWKEIAQEIGWPQGSDDSALHTLKYARDKLVSLRRRDPEGILKEAIRALPKLKARPKETK